jgi:hypothetical protein
MIPRLAMLLGIAVGLVAIDSGIATAETSAAKADPVAARRQSVLQVASKLLDEAQVSYVYGGHQLGDSASCESCNQCLTERHPAAAQRLKECTICRDCSHFTSLVFGTAGLPYPYLETARMLSLSGASLQERYQLVDVGDEPRRAVPGDLLVYDGHVVLLERVHPPRVELGPRTVIQDTLTRGDVVHATGGGAIRRPGEGIQRERFVDLGHFRGPLRRVLRHVLLASPQIGLPASSEAHMQPSMERSRPSPAWPPKGRLRPVLKASGDDS